MLGLGRQFVRNDLKIISIRGCEWRSAVNDRYPAKKFVCGIVRTFDWFAIRRPTGVTLTAALVRTFGNLLPRGGAE